VWWWWPPGCPSRSIDREVGGVLGSLEAGACGRGAAGRAYGRLRLDAGPVGGGVGEPEQLLQGHRPRSGFAHRAGRCDPVGQVHRLSHHQCRLARAGLSPWPPDRSPPSMRKQLDQGDAPRAGWAAWRSSGPMAAPITDQPEPSPGAVSTLRSCGSDQHPPCSRIRATQPGPPTGPGRRTPLPLRGDAARRVAAAGAGAADQGAIGQTAA